MKKETIFVLQPRIQHYRLPVFDILTRDLNDHFNIMILGETNNGEAINGGKRNYIKHIDYKQNNGFYWWQGLIALIKKYEPTIVLFTASPRNFSCWFLLATRYFFNVKLIGWSKINSDKNNDNYLNKKIKHFFYSRFENLILYGDKSLEELENLNVVKSNKFIAYNTINTNFYNYKKISLKEKIKAIKEQYNLSKIKNIFVCIGKMVEEKKQIDVIKAWNISSINKKKSKLVFVGSGPEFDKIKANKNINDDSILFIGTVPFEYDYLWLKIANFSVFGGSLGLACQQSFLSKSLVIAPKEKSVDSEFLIHNVNSILYNKGDIDELSKIFVTVLSIDRKLVQNAYNYIKNVRNIEKMASQIFKAIKNVNC